MTIHVHATLYAPNMGGLTRDALQIRWAASIKADAAVAAVYIWCIDS
jgi:hypothetical protein